MGCSAATTRLAVLLAVAPVAWPGIVLRQGVKTDLIDSLSRSVDQESHRGNNDENNLESRSSRRRLDYLLGQAEHVLNRYFNWC